MQITIKTNAGQTLAVAIDKSWGIGYYIDGQQVWLK